MKILIADDDANVRSALMLLLDQKNGFEPCGEVVCSEDLLVQVASTLPDVILLDWELRGEGRDDLLKVLRESYPEVSLVAMSSQPEAMDLALQAGVDAFISKGEPADSLLSQLQVASVK